MGIGSPKTRELSPQTWGIKTSRSEAVECRHMPWKSRMEFEQPKIELENLIKQDTEPLQSSNMTMENCPFIDVPIKPLCEDHSHRLLQCKFPAVRLVHASNEGQSSWLRGGQIGQGDLQPCGQVWDTSPGLQSMH